MKVVLCKVFAPLTRDGLMGWIFKLVCPGYAMSVSHERLLMLKNATVNRNLGFDDVCVEKQVSVAYNNIPWTFEVSDITGEKMNRGYLIPVVKGEMVKYPLKPILGYGNIARHWEIQAAFFANHNIKPKWINANNTYGTLNETTGQWSGAVGLIQRDEADYAVQNFAGTYGRSKVAAFSQVTHYKPQYWLTKYPERLSPMWNLLFLFTEEYISQIGFLNLI